MIDPELRSRYEAHLGFTAEDKARWLEVNAKYYDDPEQGWEYKLLMHIFPQRSASVYVMPAYQSPVTGKWIDTPAQRRDDLARTGSRPWEGMAQEKQEAERRQAYQDAELDKTIERGVEQALKALPEDKKRALL